MSEQQMLLSADGLLAAPVHKHSTASSLGSDDESDPYQRDLQPPPVPKLDHTLNRFIEYASVIATEQQLQQTKVHVEQFRRGDGPHVQAELEKLAIRKDNWINRFWMNDMYLSNRVALPNNSNPAYIFPRRQLNDDKDFIRYAAALIRGLYSFKTRIDTRSLDQDIATGREKVPLCMDQYWRLFTSYRQPCIPTDVLCTHTNSELGNNEHIIVMCNMQCFVVRTVCQGEQLPMNEIEYQLDAVYRMANNRAADGVIPVGAFTTAQRDLAAQTLDEILKIDDNRKAFNWVKTASFLLCLDRSTDHLMPNSNNMTETERRCAHDALHILHGHGSEYNALNRWFDKTQNLILTREGLCGMLIEHSVAEGIVIINMVEHALKEAEEKLRQAAVSGEARRRISPKPLTWVVSNTARELLQRCTADMDKSCKNVDMNVLIFEDFGKEFIKKCKVSPDAFVQIVLQAAYFRTHHRLCSSYESAAIRRYKKGRVDNIRAAHPAALKFARTLSNMQFTDFERRAAFDEAIKHQTLIMQENITGHGIDNHLVALRDIAREYAEKRRGRAPALFSDEVYNEVMRFPLSTSQVTTTIPETFLCYGPVVPDGYGCAYNLQSNDIIFAISAFNDCAWTSTSKYRANIVSVLRDLRTLLTTHKRASISA